MPAHHTNHLLWLRAPIRLKDRSDYEAFSMIKILADLQLSTKLALLIHRYAHIGWPAVIYKQGNIRASRKT